MMAGGWGAAPAALDDLEGEQVDVNHPRGGGRELESQVVQSLRGPLMEPNRQVVTSRDGIQPKKINTGTMDGS